MKKGPASSKTSPNFRIGELVLYKTNQLIAFNKPAALPVQEDKSMEKALISLGEIYCKSKLFLVHRLDRPASGVVLFAKNKRALISLNEQFQKREIQKTYLAVVKNPPPSPAGTLIHFIKKNARLNRSFAFDEKVPGSKKAELKYRTLKSIENYHLLEIKLITGRHHQIRVQLAAIGCPVKGDVKYGFKRSNPDRSIHLHAWKLQFHHPVSKQKVELTAPVPADPVWNAFAIGNLST